VLSAVLLPLFNREGQHYILFTKRTQKVKNHKGQISFPGGVYQERDGTLINTALRECTEEIGLLAHHVEVLGELDEDVTTSGYTISPFVGFIPCPYQFKMNEEEVEEIIEIPIPALLEGNCLRHEIKTIDQQTATSYFYYYQQRVIWGATARILNQFLDTFKQAAMPQFDI
jgi:8-oxo-dGTP pyrophosphatase MutT (NUDIX family)